MFDLDNWQEIWVTITRNKIRSFLTGFGVFWGLLMLILLIGIGGTIRDTIYSNFSGFASNSCFFWTQKTSEPYKGFRKGRQWTMKTQDVKLIKEKAQSVEYVSPVLFIGGGDKNVVRNNKSGGYGVRGIYSEHFKIEGQHVIKGRLFNDIDIEKSRKVCVIGREIYETLFKKEEDPVGQYIRVNGIYFQVIGVIRPKSKVSIGGDVESTVFLPFSTTQRAFNQGQDIYFMACTAKPGYPASIVEKEIKNILKDSHTISPTDEKAIGSFNIEKEFKIFDNLFRGVDILIWFVGIGALLSGIIGISNIMLVTVRERTKEIGVRRALGAKPLSIMRQILSESFVLTAIAGFSGFFVGVSILELISQGLQMGAEGEMPIVPPFISFSTAMVSMGILIFSGILAGLIPATRALSIKAIDAIREE